MKSQFNGECQLCGKTQKLPNKLLSNHGYTVDWNIFNGICPGSRNQPYESSCELIKIQIPRVHQQIAELTNLIQQITDRSGAIGWKRLFEDSRYQWQEVEFTLENHWIGYRTKNITENQHVFASGDTAETFARRSDRHYIDRILVPRLNALREYLQWCEKRVGKWTLQPLREQK
jgi:hypothetical protein